MKCAIEDVMRSAGALMLSFEHPEVREKSAHANFVTQADVAVQDFLMERLAARWPEARFFAEEKDDNVLSDGLTFIIDPIDGTLNYLRGRACSAVSVGAVENGRAVFGAIYDPYRNMLFHAERGHGAWCGDERLHVSDVLCEHAVVSMGTAHYIEGTLEKTARSVAGILAHFGDLRRLGAATRDLTDLACGMSEGSFEWMLQPWDYCAGSLLVEEAGGRCGNIMGGEITFAHAIPFMAATPRCFDALQRVLQQAADEAEAK